MGILGGERTGGTAMGILGGRTGDTTMGILVEGRTGGAPVVIGGVG